MRRSLRDKLIISAFAILGVALALAAADRANPPDLTRYQTLSTEVVARDGTLLRPFLSKDGYWRLKTNAGGVDPRGKRVDLVPERAKAQIAQALGPGAAGDPAPAMRMANGI